MIGRVSSNGFNLYSICDYLQIGSSFDLISDDSDDEEDNDDNSDSV